MVVKARSMSLDNVNKEKERSVFVSLIFDTILIIPDIVAAILAGSVTMLADVLKCGNEILDTFFSWLTLRKISKGENVFYEFGFGKHENLMSLVVAGGMLVSTLIVLFTAFDRLMHPGHINAGGAYLGIVLMLGGVCVNTWLWIKNFKVSKKEYSPIMESQWRLFRAKAMADFSVLLVLSLSLLFSSSHWSVYIDPLASFVIVGFLIYSIYGVVSGSIYDLLDKTLEESLQLVIVRELAFFFDEYKAFHGVRSRRSGGNVFIEIFLEFDGNKTMSDVQRAIDAMKTSIEKNIMGSCVVIAPVTTGDFLKRVKKHQNRQSVG